ncbi:hypothetical protein BGZ95_011339 [Linnemannia exigua]|uniref:F-box domain-containing protein n=1 Tax=Linnemannia exigua TaxID=604196 RepID=A0AAD4DA01_9FUNG|nr:hypothetical protein BGZ95_011339 [Linnemannia exigua]
MTSCDINSSATRVFHLQELMDTIGYYLSPPELLPCVQVSRHWSQHFIPLLWQTINDRLYGWPKILKGLTTSTTTTMATQTEDDNNESRAEKEDWIRGVFVKYGHHIRHLSASGFITIVSAQAAGTCTNLRTLAAAGLFMQPYQEAQALMMQVKEYLDSAEVEVQEVLSKALVSPVFEGVVLPPRKPEELREDIWWQKWVFAQRFWLLVLQSPQLHGLRLDKNFMYLCVDFKDGFILEILASMANLTKLDANFHHHTITLEMVLEQVPRVRHFSSGYIKPLVPLYNKTFPHIHTIHCTHDLELPELLSLLRCLPNLDQLWINHFRLPTSAAAEASNNFSAAIASRLRGLHFFGGSVETAEAMDDPLADVVLPLLPRLTTLSARILAPRTAASLGTHCPELQTFRLVDHGYSIHSEEEDQPFYHAVVTLLRRCPNLKTLDAIWQGIDASDLLEEPWICRSLETLRCQIVGIDLLTSKGNIRYDVHERVYDRLAEMTQLRVLDLGHEFRNGFDALWMATGDNGLCEIDGRMYTWLSPPIPGTLELTLASGLGRLSALKKLEVFGFEGVHHRIENKEIAWMAENWPRLRTLRGLHEPPAHCRYCDDVKTRKLREYMEELRPFVKHEGVGDVHAWSYWHNHRLQCTF